VLRRANKLRCCGGAQYNCAAYMELAGLPRYAARVDMPRTLPSLVVVSRAVVELIWRWPLLSAPW
jgi:hypothetical protein